MAESFYFAAVAYPSESLLPPLCSESEQTCFGFCRAIPWKETMPTPQPETKQEVLWKPRECIWAGGASRHSKCSKVHFSSCQPLSHLDQRVFWTTGCFLHNQVSQSQALTEKTRSVYCRLSIWLTIHAGIKRGCERPSTGTNERLRQGQERAWNGLVKGWGGESLTNKLTIARALFIVFRFCSPALQRHPVLADLLPSLLPPSRATNVRALSIRHKAGVSPSPCQVPTACATCDLRP